MMTNFPNMLEEAEIYNTVVPLEDILAACGPKLLPADREVLQKAYGLAQEAHKDQKRISGAPYFSHVTRVALEIAKLGVDTASIAAGLLHDTVEDTGLELERLRAEFGAEIADMVDGVTKISTRAFRSSEEKQVENLRKMLMAMAKDIRVLIVKLADRLHNIRTIGYLPQPRQDRIARETLDVYAPLANRLGIAKWKWELEDRCMQVVYPDIFQKISEDIRSSRGDRFTHLEDAKAELLPALEQGGIKAEVVARSKHIWSIYQKMLKNNKTFDEIYDLMGLRVITQSIHDCYAAIGIIHSIWKPVPGRIKDYIAMPKSNMYQSLHTTVIGPHGHPLEVQARTYEMHRTAEVGIAAHWFYKEGAKPGGKPDPKLAFFSALSEWQNELRDSHEFMELLKTDLYEDEVFVFTPKGEVKRLNKGSNPIDFAYAVHSSVGDHTYGAKVNGKMVPLRTELKSGDIVEVLTAPNHQPSKDWLHYVKTSKAKNRIRHFFKAEDQVELAARGREMLEKECQAENFQMHDFFKSAALLEAARHFSLASIEDLLGAVGQRQVIAKHVLAWIRGGQPVSPGQGAPAPFAPPQARKPAGTVSQGVEVKGLSGMLVTFAQCCSPVPGDAILGYITVGRGVSVHRIDCVNAPDLSKKSERLVEVAWAGGEAAEARPVDLQVVAYDRPRLMADMLLAIGETRISGDRRTMISAASARGTEEDMAEGLFTVMVVDLDHLRRIMLALHQVKGVTSVKRREKSK